MSVELTSATATVLEIPEPFVNIHFRQERRRERTGDIRRERKQRDGVSAIWLAGCFARSLARFMDGARARNGWAPPSLSLSLSPSTRSHHGP